MVGYLNMYEIQFNNIEEKTKMCLQVYDKNEE